MVVGCGHYDLDEVDEIYWPWQGQVHCATGIDSSSGNSLDSVRAGLARSAETGTVLELFTHAPGRTVSMEMFEGVLEAALAANVDFVTYDEMAAGGPPRAGLALGLDDNDLGSWTAARELLARYGAHVTFFVSRYHTFDAAMKAQLADLASDGHAIAAHSVNHLDGVVYVEEHGLAAYLADEVVPSIDWLRADGYQPQGFAYPWGRRTGEMDRAILEYVPAVRSVTFTIRSPVISDPCPE